MDIMRNRLTRVGLRRVALFVAVAAAVAVITVLAAREAGIGDAPAAAGPVQSSPLQSDASATAQQAFSLTLSAPEICETERGIGGDYATGLYDDEGNPTGWKDEYLGHFNVAETPVKWRVTGGTGPYTLVIDGETRDAKRKYWGAQGTASVSCAITTVEAFMFSVESRPNNLQRAYRSDPQVDSGWKTVRAVVTDANGDTAEATVDVYVILDTGSPDVLLRRGRTYRVFGHLLTVPQGLDLRIGEAATGEGGTGAVSLDVEGSQPLARIWLDDTSFREIRRIVPNLTDLVRGAQAESVDLNKRFDALMQSLGRLPSRSATGQ